ncbi:MAG: transporter [Aquabacterium sp.]|uniref:SphA family protein n=1 Tax=Aquabacterium sp. TaxID=1872578 RepID=UPI0027199019|nr:transporter [Aquabacterium sp.]MDO9003225.1 transporter [Aquabacterium sp.]
MNTFRRDPSSACALTLKTVALAAALSASSVALAAENGNQRYSPGVGGSDMTSPLVPGWYGQVAMVAYHANKIKGNDGKQLQQSGNISQTQLAASALSAVAPAFPNGINYSGSKVGIKADTYALLPRITYLSSTQWLGGNVGFTAMLPLVRRKIELTGETATINPTAVATISALTSIPQANVAAGLSANVQAGIAAKSSAAYGIGDLEVSPIWHMEIGDHQHVTIAPTVVLPTGDYDATKRSNSGFGNFFTFRPSVQYAFVGDGWDVGGRLVLSFNTRNKDNGYRSGNVLNIDYQAMKFVTEDIRVGLQGYVVEQFTKDSQDLTGFSLSQQATLATSSDLSTGNEMRVYAAGPAVAWLANGGEFMLEGKFLKEFGAKNRTEGQAFWLTLSKPL